MDRPTEASQAHTERHPAAGTAAEVVPAGTILRVYTHPQQIMKADSQGVEKRGLPRMPVGRFFVLVAGGRYGQA